MNYYNEFDPNAAAWLRQLIADKQIPNGTVDDRSITEVTPNDLKGFTQCHFFAGVGGWSLALRLTGVPEDRNLWTASLPCQPFSTAGKQLGTDDERHLAPVFLELVRQCNPATLFGEQVASKIARTQWLPGIRLELEALGYSFGAVDLSSPCAGEIGEGRIVRGDQESWERVIIGKPHIRQRLYWVAHHQGNGLEGCRGTDTRGGAEGIREGSNGSRSCSTSDGLADTTGDRGFQRISGERGSTASEDAGCRGHQDRESDEPESDCESNGLADSDSERRAGIDPLLRTQEAWADGAGHLPEVAGSGSVGRIPNSSSTRLERHGQLGDQQVSSGWQRTQRHAAESCSHVLLPCRDGKTRRTESGIFPLVAGISRGVVPSGDPGAPEYANATAEARAARLKGYGNAIQIDTAVLFIQTAFEALADTTP